jgi:3',5'-cyclic AMP phosphodiesterase CpdA
MRIVHLTDLHFQTPPWRRLTPKRLLGSANLYARGRRRHFSREVQERAIAAALAAEPDLVLITGDLTAQALPEEFEAAREALQPLLSAVPTFVQNGNHDVYTRGSSASRRIEEHFAPWMGEPTAAGHDVRRLDVGEVTVIGIDPCRPALLASGKVPDATLAALPDALGAVPAERFLAFALHYPILDRRGALYDKGGHGLVNAGALVEVLRASPRKPDLIVHGHQHHGYTVPLDLGDAVVPIHNPGSSGYAVLPHHDRAGCLNVYEVHDGRLSAVSRLRAGPDGFRAEPGGAYATGR